MTTVLVGDTSCHDSAEQWLGGRMENESPIAPRTNIAQFFFFFEISFSFLLGELSVWTLHECEHKIFTETLEALIFLG